MCISKKNRVSTTRSSGCSLRDDSCWIWEWWWWWFDCFLSYTLSKSPHVHDVWIGRDAYLALRRVMVFLDKKCVMLFTKNILTTFSNGCLGSRNDEERSEMRYVMRIAEFSESSNFWTQIALPGTPGSMPVSVSVDTTRKSSFFLFFCRKECTTLWRTLMLASLTRMHSSM